MQNKKMNYLYLILLSLFCFRFSQAYSQDLHVSTKTLINQSKPVYIIKKYISYMSVMPGDTLNIELKIDNPLKIQLSHRVNSGAWTHKERFSFKVDEKLLADNDKIIVETKGANGEYIRNSLRIHSSFFLAPKIERIEINGTYIKSGSSTTDINKLDLMPGQTVDLNVVAKDPKGLDLQYAFEGLVNQGWQKSSRLRFTVTEKMLKLHKELLIKIKNLDLKLHEIRKQADDSKELEVVTEHFRPSRIEFLDVYIGGKFVKRMTSSGEDFDVEKGESIKVIVGAKDPLSRLMQFRFNKGNWGYNQVYLSEGTGENYEHLKVYVKNDDGYAHDVYGSDEGWYVSFYPKSQEKKSDGDEGEKKGFIVLGGRCINGPSVQPKASVPNLDELIYTFLNRRIVFLSDLDRFSTYTKKTKLSKELARIVDRDSTLKKLSLKTRESIKKYKKFGEELLDSAKAYGQARKKLKATLTQMQTHLKERPNLASKSLVKELEGYAKQLNLKGKFTAKDMKKAKELKETYREIMNDFEKSCLPGEEIPLPKERSESKSI